MDTCDFRKCAGDNTSVLCYFFKALVESLQLLKPPDESLIHKSGWSSHWELEPTLTTMLITTTNYHFISMAHISQNESFLKRDKLLKGKFPAIAPGIS